MQPSAPLPQEIKTLADWLYDEFKATDPIEVKNILDTPYHFRYCVGETIETPDQVSRKVMDRQYEEHTLQPGETKILMGGAAYIFVDGVARQYLYQHVTANAKVPTAEGGMGLDHNKAEEQGANASADVQQLVEAARLAIVGKVGYAPTSQQAAATQQPTMPTVNRVQQPTADPNTPAGHNPNAIADNTGTIPSQTGTGQEVSNAGSEDDDAFANINATDERFSVVPATDSEDGKAHFFVDQAEVTNDEYNEAVNAAKTTA